MATHHIPEAEKVLDFFLACLGRYPLDVNCSRHDGSEECSGGFRGWSDLLVNDCELFSFVGGEDSKDLLRCCWCGGCSLGYNSLEGYEFHGQSALRSLYRHIPLPAITIVTGRLLFHGSPRQ